MIKNIILVLIVIFSSSCKHETPKTKVISSKVIVHHVETANYEIFKPEMDIHGVLILFGGYPETPEDIKREFKILALAKENGIAVFIMSFNKHLWLEEQEKESLSIILKEAFINNKLPTDNIYIGGFSSGGNISLLLSNYLIKKKSKIQPKGVFIVDSPVDLLELYNSSSRNIDRNFSEVSIQESKGIINSFDINFNKAEHSIKRYERYSPFTTKTKNINNVKLLNEVKIRFYTEPDTLWWKEKRQSEYEDLNAYNIKNLSTELIKKYGNQNIELIETANRGYRADGSRHPHSWSIIDKKDLVNWILSVR